MTATEAIKKSRELGATTASTKTVLELFSHKVETYDVLVDRVLQLEGYSQTLRESLEDAKWDVTP